MAKSQQDKKAQAAGWIILKSREAYEKTLSKYSAIYILKEERKWIVWRGYWYKGKSTPFREKIIISTYNFDTAITRANGYINWIRSKRVREQKSKRIKE